MSETRGFADRWNDFRPSKTLWLWSCVGCVVATVIIGFTYGGWVTGGTADAMAARGADDARNELVANLCVQKFMAAPNASRELAALKETGSYQQDDFIEDGGWVTLSGIDESFADAADLCADKLAGMEVPAADASPALDDNGTTDS